MDHKEIELSDYSSYTTSSHAEFNVLRSESGRGTEFDEWRTEFYFRYLQQIHSAVYQSGSRPPRAGTSSSVLDLSKVAAHLAETVKFKFLGSVPVTVQAVSADDPTPAERLAQEVSSRRATSLSPNRPDSIRFVWRIQKNGAGDFQLGGRSVGRASITARIWTLSRRRLLWRQKLTPLAARHDQASE